MLNVIERIKLKPQSRYTLTLNWFHGNHDHWVTEEFHYTTEVTLVQDYKILLQAINIPFGDIAMNLDLVKSLSIIFSVDIPEDEEEDDDDVWWVWLAEEWPTHEGKAALLHSVNISGIHNDFKYIYKYVDK
jgi:hypothetical protein